MESYITDLRVEFGPLRLKNPVLAASGTFGYGDEFSHLSDPSDMGGIVLKGISLRPRAGNPPPRIVETPAGMLNAIGLANIGVDRFLEEKVPRLREMDTVVIANIYGHTLEEYGAVARRLEVAPEITALEVNISCPNVAQGGVAFGTDPGQSAAVTRCVLDNTDKPVIVKLSPNVTDIRPIARAVEEAGAAAISLINTITGMVVDVETRRPRLGNVTGGLSGPAIRPVALRMVYEAVNTVNIPVIGVGGIVTAHDALEFLIAGASAVQVGTAHFVDPRAGIHIVKGLDDYCKERGIGRLGDLIGSLQVN
ncbi:MAG: dihydroorotate dehydrogenase [Deltaproteobacteria bacterium]|nr:dihydroorotate dehydrogenase [Deltaproteobacteria bacterium]MBW1948534.1 dihydroorotate dehydrogenase [Deltaproteobacteria bacterium]MBW2006962.1 dihydroorotate dehydrogenase [Deltaproteobacteria bacterium]MBW2347553.1 dihydroorotate dehydrogenase [Deltaproteobacteria bacterium]